MVDVLVLCKNEQTDGWTALMLASRNGHDAVARTLLSSDANVNQAEVRNGDDDDYDDNIMCSVGSL